MLGVREEGEIDRGSPRQRFYRDYQLTTQSRRKHFSLPWWNIENRLLHSKILATNKLNSSPFTVLVGALEIIIYEVWTCSFVPRPSHPSVCRL